MPKRVEAEVSKLEGSPLAERGKFAQAYEYTPSEEELLEKRGRLFVVLDLAGDPAFDAALAGKLVWDSLSEDYFSETEEPPIKALERAILTVKDQLTSLTQPSEEGKEVISSELEAKEEVKLNLVVVVVWGNPPAGEAGVLYLARQGKPTIYLKRTGQVRELLASEEPSSIASVLVEDGDVVILGSQNFGKNFTPASLPEISFLENEFKSGQQVPGLAAIVLKLKVKEAGKPEAAPQPSPGEAEEEQARLDSARQVTEPFAPKRGLKLPSAKEILKRLPKRKGGLPLPPDGVKGGVQALGSTLGESARRVGVGLGARIARGREVYLEKKRPEIGLPKVITALALIFLLSVTLTLWRQRQRTRAEEFSRLLSSIGETMIEAEDLIDFSDERAKELWQEARGELEKAATLNPKDERLSTLWQQIETLYNRIEKITPVTEEHLFYDLALQPFGLAQGEQVQALSLTGRVKTVYVAEGKTGATLAIKGVPSGTPQVEEATANEVKEAKRIGIGGDFLYLLTDKNFYRYNLKTGKKDAPVEFNRYDKVAAFDLYLEQNIYFLVPSENQIYRFWSGYTKADSWLKETVVLEEAIDLTIDGSLWVLLKNGTVFNLLAGKKEAFSFKNLPTPVSEPTAIYTRPNFKHLYIADGDRVVVFEKSGQFVKQFKGEVLDGLVDLWVTEDEKTLFLLTQSKIFKVGL